jgi:hypothetical protein
LLADKTERYSLHSLPTFPSFTQLPDGFCLNKFPVFPFPNLKKRKEVIHPQLRLGIPCYDLSFIAKLGLSRKKHDSSTPDFAALTGGVYKTRERIHRGLLIRDYY